MVCERVTNLVMGSGDDLRLFSDRPGSLKIQVTKVPWAFAGRSPTPSFELLVPQSRVIEGPSPVAPCALCLCGNVRNFVSSTYTSQSTGEERNYFNFKLQYIIRV